MSDRCVGYVAAFTVAEGRELDATLDREAAAAMAVAHPLGLGLVLTRHDARSFTIEASPEVPAGIIRERDLFAGPDRPSTR